MFSKISYLLSPKWKLANVAGYALLCLIAFIPYMVVFYPGIVEVDTSFQIAMSLGYGYGTVVDYASPFPVFDIRLLGILYAIGEAVGGDATSGIWTICLFQCVGIACSVSLISCYLEKWNVPRWARILVFIFLAFNPIVPLMAIDVGKDTLFCMFFIPFAVCISEYMRRAIYGEQAEHGSTALLVCTTLSAIFSFLTTSKGIVIVIICLFSIVFIAWRRHRKQIARNASAALGVCLAAQLLFSLVLSPIMSQGLPDSSSFLRESFGTPIQQATWVAKVNGQLTDTERERLNNFYNLDAAVDDLIRDTSDNSKVHVGKDASISDAVWFFDAYVSIGLSHPKEYLKSFIDLYDGYWQMNTMESLMLPRLMPNNESNSPLSWEDNMFRFPGDIDDAIEAINNDWVIYSHGNLPEYAEQHPDFGNWKMNDENSQARKDIFTFIMQVGKIPVLGLLVSKSLYATYLPLLLLGLAIFGIRKPNKGAAIWLLAPLGVSCVFAFLSPADLARYVYPCLMLVPLYLGIIAKMAIGGDTENSKPGQQN